MSDSRPIGVFDSGLGGLTVAKAIKEKPINTLVDICLGKEYHNHGDVSINLKMVRTLDAAYRSMKSEKLEIA